ncbi:MAG TPA: heme lyase CcmF/NrfE family subunit, partial [Thermodesulfobacteriota bacterium]|nr:heme lyase CcmF/NrfE family subunit [Thermodesulfobacteriota bacterium]
RAMTATVGQASLLAAFVLALLGAAAPVAAVRAGRPAWFAAARAAVLGQFALVTLAALALVYALVTTDFSLRYVAFNTTRATPIYYRVTGLWGALEGSLLLWEWILLVFAALVAWRYRDRHRELLPWVMLVFSTVSAFFLAVMAFASTPFETLSPAPPDGRGLNPLLEDTNMLSHPPLLYTGFVGLTVPYAFAMAALVTGRLDETWIVTTRRWTLTAWAFLTAGNLVGAWWSYHVLGWGGYWAWDPVENAAFMPWLPATAFLHSIQIQERRGMLKTWNLALIILAFSLTIFGTFLTRSGILSSVHAFSSGPVGAFFLGFLALVLVASFGLLAWRADRLKGQPELDSPVSRESAFLLNNVVLVSALFAVFLGTVFPLLAEAVAGVKVSVGAPYFNRVTTPLFLVLVFLMGVGPLVAWRKASLDNLRRNFLGPAAGALAVGFALFAWRVRDFWPLLAFTLSAFVVLTIVLDVARAVAARRRASGEGRLAALAGLVVRNQRRYGGFVVHLGVVLIVLGIAGSMAYSVEREATLRRGEGLAIGRYWVVFEGLAQSRQPTHLRVEGRFRVFNEGHEVGVLAPALKFFPTSSTPVGRAVFRSTPVEDLYLILSGFSPVEQAEVTLKALVRPLVAWIWLGGAVMALGTLVAIWPLRRAAAAARQGSALAAGSVGERAAVGAA